MRGQGLIWSVLSFFIYKHLKGITVMFGFLKSQLCKKLETIKITNTEDVISNWNEIGTLVLHCKKRDVSNVDKWFDMCYNIYKNTIQEYINEIHNLNMGSQGCGKVLFECYDIIVKYADEYEELTRDLSDQECNDFTIKLRIMHHHLNAMEYTMKIRDGVCAIIEDVAKNKFGQAVRDITNELDLLKNETSKLQNKLTQEYANSNSFKVECNDKELDLDKEPLMQTRMMVDSYKYALQNPEMISIYDEMEALSAKRRKMMEEYNG